MIDKLSAAGVGTGKQSNRPLKWTGSKGNHLDYVKPIWDKFKDRRLVEPFAGSLAISFGLKPAKVLANDVNRQLINFYNQMKANPVIDLEMLNDETYYYSCRDDYNTTEDERYQAELFYYLNRYCFNGLHRVNSQGKFNVAFGKYPYSRGLNDLSQFFSHCKDWEFISGDFSAITLDNNSDFIFADPPFVTEFTEYATGGFNWDDQIRVCEWLRDFQGPAIICNQRTDETDKLYKAYGYTITETRRPKNFKGKSTMKSKEEIMAIKNV